MQYASITVTDIELAKDVYVNKLGFKLLVETPHPGGNKFVMVRSVGGEKTVVFSLPFPGREQVPSFSIAFTTDSVEETYAELTAQGVTFNKEPAKTPRGGMEDFFVDPSGNTFTLHQG